jgi:tetratricopeptide (TPR) repeat protein
MIKQIKILLIGVMAWLAFAGQALASVPANDLIKEANTLLSQYKDREALAKFQLVLMEDPSHYEALYKASLLNTRIGMRYSDESEKIEYFSAAKGYAEMALKVNPKGADGHYVLALAVNNLSIVSGTKNRVLNLKLVKQHLDNALIADPRHAAAWQLLGRWYYKVANFNFLEATACKFLAGGVPVGASNYKAIESIRKSITFNPNNISGFYDLAIIYRDMKQKAESISVLQEALQLNLITSEDLEISRRCKALLQDLGSNNPNSVNNTSSQHSRI